MQLSFAFTLKNGWWRGSNGHPFHKELSDHLVSFKGYRRDREQVIQHGRPIEVNAVNEKETKR